MKNIDITQIVSPTSKQPFTANSLKFLQDYNAENLASVIKSIITTNLGSYSLTVPYVISGCVVSDAGKDVTAGEIFYGGKYYATTAVDGTTNVARFILTKTQDGVADPLEFTNGDSKNVHDIFTYVATDVASGGDFTSANLVSAYPYSSSQYPVDFSTSSATDVDLGASITTPNDGITRNWVIQGKCNGVLNAVGSMTMNLYIGSVADFCLIETLSASNTRNTMVVGPIVTSVPPNTIIKLTGRSGTGGSVTFAAIGLTAFTV
jgi:hypothetical protein